MRSEDDKYALIWPQPAITLTVRTAGSLPVPVSDLLESTVRAAGTWSAPANDSSVALDVVSSESPPIGPTFDRENTISFRMSDWNAPTYGPNVLALTTVFSQGGAIVDTDTELNGVSPPEPWALLPDDPALAMMENDVDLQAALTHELGHALGLEHPCTLGVARNPSHVDNLGNPVPACSPALPESILSATMYPSASAGQIQERLLSGDELLALHELYPAGRAPIVEGASAGDSGGCATGGTPVGRGPGAAIGLAAILLARQRRRR